jgi:tRNA(guanine-26,N2-N2) methyltransferase
MQNFIEEGDSKINLKLDNKISKKLPVFYNPLMKLNRDISIYLLNAYSNLYDLKNLRVCLPLAGSGIRGIRFLKELNETIIENIYVNDLSEEAFKSIKKNLKLNKLEKDQKIVISNKDANLFFLESDGFDYIDIDPFGSPNSFLDSAINRLSRKSILAVTATDTAPLCGTFIKTCRRKYWANPLHNELMHEIGLRILIRKVQLIASQYEKALTPILSYSKDHYMRIFFKCEKGKKKVDEIIKQHDTFYYNDFTIYLNQENKNLSLPENNTRKQPIHAGSSRKYIAKDEQNIFRNDKLKNLSLPWNYTREEPIHAGSSRKDIAKDEQNIFRNDKLKNLSLPWNYTREEPIHAGSSRKDIAKDEQNIFRNDKLEEINYKYGPIWTGNLFDKNLLNEMDKQNILDNKTNKFITQLSEEEDVLGFYDIHKIAEKLKLNIPKMDLIINKLKEKGFKASRTHFSEYGIKTNANVEEIIKIMKD